LERFVVKGEGEGGKDRGEEGTWERAIGGDMNAVYGYLLEARDREHAIRLEHLDEVEEWHMLMVITSVEVKGLEKGVRGG